LVSNPGLQRPGRKTRKIKNVTTSQDDGLVGTSQVGGFVEFEKHSGWACQKQEKSKKSQPLRMTISWEG
jgi:hypothetical protein